MSSEKLEQIKVWREVLCQTDRLCWAAWHHLPEEWLVLRQREVLLEHQTGRNSWPELRGRRLLEEPQGHRKDRFPWPGQRQEQLRVHQRGRHPWLQERPLVEPEHRRLQERRQHHL